MTAPETTIAIVPVKALTEAKSRLASVLAPQSRRRLVLEMLDDVLLAVLATSAISRTIVVTSDPDVAEAARRRSAEVVHEPDSLGLNAAIRLGLHDSQCKADSRCLILPADVPLVTREEISEVLRREPDGKLGPRVVLAPSHDGGGTNALLLTDHDLMGPSFGVNSFQRHLDLAHALRLEPRVVRLPGLGFDVDTPQDLRRLSQVERYRWLGEAWLSEPKFGDPKSGAPAPAHQTA
jgi:2-phospho-L-lactate/phosphoenolpyruvate guanylyltransferase